MNTDWHDPLRRTVSYGGHAGRAGGRGLTQLEGAAVAEGGFAEGVDAVAHGVGQGEVKTIVGNLVQLDGTAHLKTEAAADEDKGNVVEGVGVAFTEFVGPDDQGVVQQ